MASHHRRALPLLVALLCLLAAACQRSATATLEATPREAVTARLAADVALQADDRVDLALYFRRGSGDGAHLVRVMREVPVSDDLPRRAVELLLAGPTPADGDDLVAPLPPDVRVLDLQVADGIAALDLSREVLTSAQRGGTQPDNELLALAAVADTLTEFPGIEAVRLSIEGRQVGQLDGVDIDDFWGGWGLPEQLVRDETVIGPRPDRLGMPNLAGFSRSPQRLTGDETTPVTIRSLRLRDHTTFLRIVVEVGGGDDPAQTVPPPSASARAAGQTITLAVKQVGAYHADLGIGQTLEISDPAFESITVSRQPGSSVVSFVLECRDDPEYSLHSLSSPTRVVLDIRK